MSLWIVILWLHLLGVVVWIGGLFFQVLVLTPALRYIPSETERLRVDLGLSARFRSVMRVAVGLVLATGLYNAMKVFLATTGNGGTLPAAFVQLLGLKLLLVVMLLILMAVERFAVQRRCIALLADASAVATEFPAALYKLVGLSRFLRVLTLLLAVAVLLLGVLLRG